MKVLVVTNMYPTEEQPAFGIFVQEQVEALRKAGVQVDVLFVNGRKSRLNYFWGIARYWRTLLKGDMDIVHAHHAITGLLARLQLCRPLVVTYHGTEVSNIVPSWLSFLARRGARIFDRIIVVNKTEQNLVSNDEKVRLIPCGIDLDKFQPISRDEARHALSLPVEKPLVLWVGQHRQWVKRLDLAEKAMQVVKQQLPEAELVVVSGQPHSVVPTYMCACDVLLLTSRYEGSPMVIKEAMACNLPIVSTRVGDVAELLDGVDGCYLVEPDPEIVASRLVRVLESGRRTSGRVRIEHLNSEAVARRVISVYDELLASN
jgi:teichuronic acid biosynthesis glycosyltransferase TuaC